jgi:hypothetical protein
MTVPYSIEMEQTYENFIAKCPHCQARNIFNRASDLHTFKPIDFRAVTCQTCGGCFNINSDSINAPHEMLLSDCYSLIDGKQYMQCVLSVAQAYEVFFSRFLHVHLIYRAFAKDGSHDLPRLNRLTKRLHTRLRRLPFVPMRDLVLKLIVSNVAPASLAEAEASVAALPKKDQKVQPVQPQTIEAIPDDRLKALLLHLQASKINKLRNRVIHEACRPTLEEANCALVEAREILFGLTDRLRLGFAVHWYISKAGR